MSSGTSQRWLVTGGSRGIGAAVAAAAAAQGHRVAILSRRPPETLPAGALHVPGDVTDPASIESAAAQVAEAWGGIDVLVNNAGVHRGGRIERIERDAFLEVLTTNLVGPFDTIRAVLPHIGDRGAIVNIGAVVGLRGFPGDTAYASAKAGLTGLTLALATELAPRGITVNMVLPGFTVTDMTSALSDRARDSILRRIPMGREATAAEVADVVLSVAASTYMTGSVVAVDGGLMAALGSAT